MKKTMLTLVVATATLFSFGTSAQVVSEGNVIVDAYYGGPNFYGTIFKAAYAENSTDVKVSSLGPIGIRAEYMLADKFGMGIDFGYNNMKIGFTDDVTSYDENGAPSTATYNYDFSTSKINAFLTFNYHFLESSDKLDLYGVLGAGYRNRGFKFESNEPGYTESGTVETLMPVGFRLAFGMRYFFTENIGINAAIGSGISMLSGGVSLKF